MSDDQFWRIAVTASVLPLWAWGIQKAKAYLRAERDKSGRSLEQRLAYRLGRLWSRCYRSGQ